MSQIRSYDPSIDASYEPKQREFVIKPVGLPPDIPKDVVKMKERVFAVNEMTIDSDIEKIYMEIAYQSRLSDYLQYVFNVKKTHERMLKGLSVDIRDIQEEPLHSVACRVNNRSEYDILKNKLKNTK